MFEKLSDNLNLLMAKTRINASELARRTGLPASTIKKIRNHDNPNPTLSTLIPLAKCFSISLSQLIGDEAIELDDSIVERNAGASIPLIEWKEAISWPEKMIIAKQSVQVAEAYSQHAYALTVEEDWEGFSKGSVLYVDPHGAVEHRDFVIVHKENQDVPVLRQVLYDEGIAYLKPVVTGYRITPLTPQHTFLGVVMEYRKKLK